jgi:hypothetical protein
VKRLVDGAVRVLVLTSLAGVMLLALPYLQGVGS